MAFLGILFVFAFLKESWCLSMLQQNCPCSTALPSNLLTAQISENFSAFKPKLNYIPVTNDCNAVPSYIGDMSVSEIVPNLQFGEILCNGELPITGTINVKGFFPVYGTVTVDGVVPTSGVAVANTGCYGKQGSETINPCPC